MSLRYNTYINGIYQGEASSKSWNTSKIYTEPPTPFGSGYYLPLPWNVIYNWRVDVYDDDSELTTTGDTWWFRVQLNPNVNPGQGNPGQEDGWDGYPGGGSSIVWETYNIVSSIIATIDYLGNWDWLPAFTATLTDPILQETLTTLFTTEDYAGLVALLELKDEVNPVPVRPNLPLGAVWEPLDEDFGEGWGWVPIEYDFGFLVKGGGRYRNNLILIGVDENGTGNVYWG